MLSRYLCLCACLLMLFATAIQAAELNPALAQVTALKSVVGSSKDLGESEAARLNKSLDAAHGLLTALQEQQNTVDAYQREASSYPESSKELQARIQTLLATPPLKIDSSEPMAVQQEKAEQLELTVHQQRATLIDTREHAFWLDERASFIASIITSSSGSKSSGKTQSTVASRLLDDASNAADTLALTTQVQELVDRVSAHVANKKRLLLQQELSTLAPRQTLADLKARAEGLVLEGSVNELNQRWAVLNKARIAASSARLQAARSAPNTAFSGAVAGGVDGTDVITLAQAQVTLLESELALQRQSSSVAQSLLDIKRIQLVLAQTSSRDTANHSLADELRELRRQLPDTEVLANETSQLESQKRSLLVNRLLWESALREFGTLQSPLAGTTGRGEEQAATDLALLVDLLGTANRTADRMIGLEAQLGEAQSLTSEVVSTLDGSVLWLRTNQTAGPQWVKNVFTGALWISTPGNWSAVGTALRNVTPSRLLLLIFPVVAFIGLLAIRPRLSVAMSRAAAKVGHVGQDTYWLTPAIVLVSLLWALPLPLLCASLYWVLADVIVFQGSTVPALKLSLQAVGSVLMVFLFFRALSKPEGVFRRHFEWSETSVDRLYRHLGWFVWVCALATAFFTLSMASGLVFLRYGLGVLAFMVGSVAMSALLQICLRPNRGVAFEVTAMRTRSSMARLGIWVLIMLPLAIGLLPLFGYFDTAVAIQSKAFNTVVLLIMVVILVGLAIRHFLVAHRRLSLRKVRRRRAAREAERAAQEDLPVSGDATPDLSLESDGDYHRVAAQAQRFIRTTGVVLFLIAVWFVWKPLFPALSVFDNIVLWSGTVTTNGTAVAQPVTLAKLLLALAVVVLGVLITRSLRVFLDVILFERMKLDSGARYAIHAILSYILIGSALLFSVAQLGVDWSKFQWIVAALGVGLGFGLQEIVANFICGLIILFERPVRVGDTVTIGTVSGTVSKIQIRATTLTDFDNLEVILPNKLIITDTVTNWTLNDAVTRITLMVGVAYGSDVDQVRRILGDCLENAADVMKVPEPTVFFVNHGDSALSFEIRAFVPTPAHRLPVTDTLNSAVNSALAAHGIDIPFPQRVVRMESPPGTAHTPETAPSGT